MKLIRKAKRNWMFWGDNAGNIEKKHGFRGRNKQKNKKIVNFLWNHGR